MSLTTAPSVSTSIPDSIERLLTPVEAATLLGVRPSTLAKWRYRGVGPKHTHLSLAPQSVKYRLSEIVRFINSQTTMGEISNRIIPTVVKRDIDPGRNQSTQKEKP